MSKSSSSGKGSGTPRPTDRVGAGAPNPPKCRVEVIGFQARSFWCLVRSPRGCQFAQPFGDRFLCEHPQRERIVARTLAEKPRSSH